MKMTLRFGPARPTQTAPPRGPTHGDAGIHRLVLSSTCWYERSVPMKSEMITITGRGSFGDCGTGQRNLPPAQPTQP